MARVFLAVKVVIGVTASHESYAKTTFLSVGNFDYSVQL